MTGIQTILVGVYANGVAVFFAGSFQNTLTGGTGGLEDDVGTLSVELLGSGLALDRIEEVADIGGQNFNFGIDVVDTLFKALVEAADNGNIVAADKADNLFGIGQIQIALGDQRRADTGQEAAFLVDEHIAAHGLGGVLQGKVQADYSGVGIVFRILGVQFLIAVGFGEHDVGLPLEAGLRDSAYLDASLLFSMMVVFAP